MIHGQGSRTYRGEERDGGRSVIFAERGTRVLFQKVPRDPAVFFQLIGVVSCSLLLRVNWNICQSATNFPDTAILELR